MGKYMKKSKITGDIAVMEVTQSTTLGVRTRARTLASQRLQEPSSPTTTATAAVSYSNPDTSSFCYLQLRSRRLEKPLSPPPHPSASTTYKTQQTKVKLCVGGGERKRESCRKKGGLISCEVEDMGGVGVEVSFGDNCLNFETIDRSTRETTPCSLIRDSKTIGTPGSASRQNRSNATNQKSANVMNAVLGNIPSMSELEEFFACVEQQQHRLFIEKYNFDVVNDLPRPGRYEWVQVIP